MHIDLSRLGHSYIDYVNYICNDAYISIMQNERLYYLKYIELINCSDIGNK